MLQSAAIPDGFDALAFYTRLRPLNPATFSAFLDYGDVQIASSSPERLLSFDGTTVEARPIKGTRRRDPDPARDAALVAELASSRKDRAENVMIVDLLRNDLSPRVRARQRAGAGAVRPGELCLRASSDFGGDRRTEARTRPWAISSRRLSPAARSPARPKSAPWK